MSVIIKKEEVVNESLDDEFSDSNYECQNENFKMLLSINKQNFDVRQSMLETQIVEMKKSVATLESEIISLKHSNDELSNIIAEKNKFLNIVYSTIDNLEVKENIPVINPKTAVLKLNKYQAVTKEFRDQVVDNKIILMTLCRILGCSNTKIVQSLKDLINEKESIKQKFKVYEQFYQRSVASMNQMSSDLHLNGYDKSISSVKELNTVCIFHSESFDNWSIKMANLRSKCMNKSEKIISKSIPHIPKSQEINRQLYAKQQIFRDDAYLKNNFYQTIPPPVPIFPYRPFPPTMSSSLLPTPPNISPFPRNPQYRYETSCLPRPPNCIKANNSKMINNRLMANKYHSDIPSVEKENPDKSSSTTNFEINSNVFDWQNCSSEEAKEELSKLEKKMLEDLSPITSSSNGAKCVSPSITLVEDKSEVWEYDSDSDSDCVETKRCKWGI